jgi:hypothetical protein
LFKTCALAVQYKHWCGSQRKNGWKCAPMLYLRNRLRLSQRKRL